MPRNYKLKELILESLDEIELSKKKLLEHIIKNLILIFQIKLSMNL